MEMNFTASSGPGPTPHHAFMMSNLRLRDGYDQSSNLLGVFCGTGTLLVLCDPVGKTRDLRRTDIFHYYYFQIRGSYTSKAAYIKGK